MDFDNDIQLLSATHTVSLEETADNIVEPDFDHFYADEHIDLLPHEHLMLILIRNMSTAAKETIARHLDPPSIGQALYDWQHVAMALGVNSRDIRSITDCCRSRGSPTMCLLDNFASRHTTAQLFKALKDNRRLDVIAAMSPHLYQNERLSALSTSDSGLIQSPASSVLDAAIDCFGPGPSGYKLLITYANDTDKHLKMVEWLCTNLRQSSLECNVRKQKDVLKPDRSIPDCLDAAFKQASIVLIVLSPLYRGTVESSHATNDNEAIMIRYIYKLVQNEYMQGGCQLGRVICVIFDKLHLEQNSTPLGMLSNTLHYAWPSQNTQLCNAIKNKLP